MNIMIIVDQANEHELNFVASHSCTWWALLNMERQYKSATQQPIP